MYLEKLFLFLLASLSSLPRSTFTRASEFPAEQECPEECDCHYFRVNYVTDCSESNMTEIPYDEISLNVYILDMNGNEISDIRPFPEDNKIRRLQLAENKISKLTPEMFSSLKYILEIDLSSNNISKVDPNAFRDLHGLITVELQNNPLLNVEAGPFLKCRSLLYLDLSDCGLSKLNGDFFTETPHINHLDLSGNPMSHIISSVFNPLTSLSELLLSNCNLTDLQPKLFENQVHLKLLDLSGNRLASVDWMPIFSHLTRLETLILKNTCIVNLPEDVFINNTFLRILTLSDNELTDFDIKTTLGENLKNLNSLDLSNCRLSGPLDKKSFLNATTLKSLNLSGNRLSSRDLSVALSPLTRLTTLSLKNCSLSKLPSSTFENLTQLKELDISWNPLNKVFDDLLDSLKNLEYLNMGYSNLSRLGKDTFSKTTHLKRLILSGNKLRELEMGLFKNLRSIETLEIENCGLERAIDENVFFNKTYGELRELKMAGNPLQIEEGALFPEQLSQLKVLDLSNCNLSYLPNESFDNTKNLTHLHLANNKFKSDFMSNATFLHILSNLEYLDLSGNLLTNFPPDFVGKTQLLDIKLTNNPWICDCTLADWWNWALSKGDISHLIGSTLTLEDVSTKGSKRKKGLLCRIDSKQTPPGKTSSKRRKLRIESSTKTWARYLKESDCPLSKIKTVQNLEIQGSYRAFTTPLPRSESIVLEEGDRTTGKNFYLVTAPFTLLSVVAGFALGYSFYSRRRIFAARRNNLESQ